MMRHTFYIVELRNAADQPVAIKAGITMQSTVDRLRKEPHTYKMLYKRQIFDNNTASRMEYLVKNAFRNYRADGIPTTHGKMFKHEAFRLDAKDLLVEFAKMLSKIDLATEFYVDEDADLDLATE
jgi:hypothetical protein